MTIHKDSSNNILLTLNENKTLATQDWLFKFENVETHEVKYFAAPQIASNVRINQFTIVENATENLYNGIISLNVGIYDYTIYEMPIASPISLDPNDSVAIVEVGRVYVIGTEEERKSFNIGDNNVRKSFNL